MIIRKSSESKTRLYQPQRQEYRTSHSYQGSIYPILMIYSLLIFQLFPDCDSVKIIGHQISQTVDDRNQSIDSIIMDCDYQYDPLVDLKLVVRWFYNDSPEPIYQWIPESGSRYIGQSIAKYFDINYQIGMDNFTKFRAIRLMPSTLNLTSQIRLPFPLDLSGNYSCVISSIINQDSRQGDLVLYVPPSRFEFHIFTNDVNLIADYKQKDGYHQDPELHAGPKVQCIVDGAYPQPLLTFSEMITGDGSPYASSSSSSSITAFSAYHFSRQYPTIKVNTVINESNKLYNSWFEYRLNMDQIKVGTIYECRLEIPRANYFRNKRIKLIYPSTYYHTSSRDKSSELQRTNHNNHWPWMESDFQAQQHDNQRRNSCRRPNLTINTIGHIFIFLFGSFCWLFIH